MDRGAVRSRGRAAQTRGSTASLLEALSQPGPSESPARKEPLGKPRPPRPDAKPSIVNGPNQYKPKAIRASAALIFSQAPFAIPPPRDVLANVRRVDLAGSGCTDVSWLEETRVTWLSLAGCEVKKGWDAVGRLKELSVLNISHCDLTSLPPVLKGLNKLKALVAMHNKWSALDPDVVSSWTHLNALIISHSPELTTLPHTLRQLLYLSKLTFSHCPRLIAASLPDLSVLPLLRDIKMNNLPLLTSLPAHLPKLGTGALLPSHNSSEGPSSPRVGDGLEVLDLGNCSLSFEAISMTFGLSISASKTKWPHLRSLSLHSNPLASTHPEYIELLESSPSLPNLQIIDAKRVKERKRKGELQERKLERRKRERREERMKPSGTNVTGGLMRTWGADKDDKEDAATTVVATAVDDDKTAGTEGAAGKRRRKRKRPGHFETADDSGPSEVVLNPKRPRNHDVAAQDEAQRGNAPSSNSTPGLNHRPEPRPASVAQQPPGTSVPERPNRPADEPPAVAKPTKSQTSVVRIIEIARTTEGDKGKTRRKREKGGEGKASGGLDPRELFRTASAVESEGAGLGVSRW